MSIGNSVLGGGPSMGRGPWWICPTGFMTAATNSVHRQVNCPLEPAYAGSGSLRESAEGRT